MPRTSRRRVLRPQGAPDRDQQATHRAALHYGSVYRPLPPSDKPAGQSPRPTSSDRPISAVPRSQPEHRAFYSEDAGTAPTPAQEPSDSAAGPEPARPDPGTAGSGEEPSQSFRTYLSVDGGEEILTEDGSAVWAPSQHAQPPHAGARPESSGDHRNTEPTVSALDFIRDDTGQAMIGTLAGLRPVDDIEAGTFALRFACDFLSWDEDAPEHRSQVLRSYLASGHSSTLGWNGTGRQRADAPAYGRMERRSPTTVIVEVWVRITTYERSNQARSAGTSRPWRDNGMPPSSAPAPHAPGWTATTAYWLSMAVPVTRDQRDPGGRLVVNPSLIPTATP